ncbi:MAG: hypothetical protein JWQ44_2951 [Chthoniobacter sp.]|nr:hypothetical protein [Chthoniobacter sp.]
MTHGTLERTDWQNLVTVRPGPVLHVWRNGTEFCNVPLSFTGALSLIGQLTTAMQMAGINNALPREGLPASEHINLRNAERAPYDHIGSNDE